MRESKIFATLRRTLRLFQPLSSHTVDSFNLQTVSTQATAFSCYKLVPGNTAKCGNAAVAMSGALAVAVALTNEAQSEQKKDVIERSGSNPIQNVTMLLRLYEQIDQNMSVFAARMLEDLEKTIEMEKQANDGKVVSSPEQRALNMSIAFESTLRKVQDAVFRNNYVTQEQVREAMQQLIAGTLPGRGSNGKISVDEAETIDDFVRKLGRLRWKVTGSREPLLPGAQLAAVPKEKPAIEVTTVLRIMEELIPSLTVEMEKIVTSLRKQQLADAEFRLQLSQQYIEVSSKKTEEICKEYKVNVQAFQDALMYYHDDEIVEKTLAKLAEQQQKRFQKLGL